MAQTYAALQKQIEKLQAEADALKRAEVADVVSRIKEAIRVYGLTAADLGLAGGKGPSRARRTASKSAAEVRYGDGQGNFWGGRGPRPKWLRTAIEQGRQLDEFLL